MLKKLLNTLFILLGGPVAAKIKKHPPLTSVLVTANCVPLTDVENVSPCGEIITEPLLSSEWLPIKKFSISKIVGETIKFGVR